MYRLKNIRKMLYKSLVLALIITAAPMQGVAPKQAQAAVTDSQRAVIESCLYNAEYYEKANDDVAVALNYDRDAMYKHWLDYGMAEGRNASMVFNAKYYLEKNPSVAAKVGNDYVAAYEHFVSEGLLAGLESSPVFSVKYYLEANTDVAQAFNGDYVSAAKHFNENAIAEGRSGSGNFDYTVYRACNTDVEELYGNYIEGYYIHYINHGRAEGRTGGLAAEGSGNSGIGGGSTGGGTAGDSTGGTVNIDVTMPSYRIFDVEFYLEKYPELANSVGTDADTLYLYWISEGIAQGQTASPVIVPEEYLELNSDVAEVFGDDYAAAIRHFLNDGILEGRTGSKEFDYSIYAACNTDVGGVFADDIVGYYFHYVKYGKDENRTAAAYIPEAPKEIPVSEIFATGLALTPYNNGAEYRDWWNESEICAYIEGTQETLKKGTYGVTVYIRDNVLADSEYGVELSLAREKNPYTYISYGGFNLTIKEGMPVTAGLPEGTVRVSDGYLVPIKASYELEEELENYVWIAKLHSEAYGENGTVYFGDFYINEEATGLYYLNPDADNYTYSGERLCTGEELEVRLESLTTLDVVQATRMLRVGETVELAVSGVKHNATVSYKSSDTSVATVSADGTITAKAPGFAVITILDETGENGYAWKLLVKKQMNLTEAEPTGLFENGLAVKFHDNAGKVYENWWSESEICAHVEDVEMQIVQGRFKVDAYLPAGSVKPGNYALEVWVTTEDEQTDISVYSNEFEITEEHFVGSNCEALPIGYLIHFDMPYQMEELLETCKLTFKIHSSTTEENGSIYLGNARFVDDLFGYQEIDLCSDAYEVYARHLNDGAEVEVTEQKFLTNVSDFVTKIYEMESKQVKVDGDLDEYDFESSDYAVVVIDKQGVVTGMCQGTAILTAYNDSGAKISWQVKVVRPSIGLEFEKTSVLLGETYQYVGVGYGVENTNFTWSSSNTEVGTIDASTGLFTAVAEGTTNITLKDTNSKKQYVFEVTVYKVSNSDLAEYISIETNGLISSELEQKITELLYTVYPNVFDYYADGEYNKVTCTFQKMDGVAYTMGRDMFISADYINSNPKDVDCITHELIHCAQYYPGGDVWLIEGITDYGRSLFGVYNDEANWSLATYQEGQSYTDSYGVTGGFLKYVVENHNSNMVRILNAQLKQGGTEASVWKDSTGYTIDELWEKYAAQ